MHSLLKSKIKLKSAVFILGTFLKMWRLNAIKLFERNEFPTQNFYDN